MNYKVRPSKMAGHIKLPPSKSISHRAIICASLASGKSVIENISFCEDILATLEAVESMGAEVKIHEKKVEVTGIKNVDFKNLRLNCRESGSSLRFLVPFALLTEQIITFTGEGGLPSRPLDTYFKMFEQLNIKYNKPEKNNLPLEVIGKLNNYHLEIEGHVSSQYITGLLIALAYTQKDASLTLRTPLQSKGYIDITLDVLKSFGINVVNVDNKIFTIVAGQKFTPRKYAVEGDMSALAFWAQAGMMHGNITCTNLNIETVQGDKKILDFITKLKGQYNIAGNEITFIKSKLSGNVIDLADTPDLAPALIALSATASNTTKFINTKRLAIKESNRALAISEGINKLGGHVTVYENEIIVKGTHDKLQGGCVVEGFNDHRIVMALAIAATNCIKGVTITDFNAVVKSYPDFWSDFERVTK